MSENKDLQTAKTKRLLSRSMFAIIAFILPVIIVSIKYKLITHFNGYKLSAVGLILCIVVIWRFKSKLMNWINSWEYSVMKYVLIGFSRVYLFIIVLTLLLMARQGLDTLIFCVEWICLCECIAYLLIYPLEQKCDYSVKRIIRGIERKEDYKEAIKELSGGGN